MIIVKLIVFDYREAHCIWLTISFCSMALIPILYGYVLSLYILSLVLRFVLYLSFLPVVILLSPHSTRN